MPGVEVADHVVGAAEEVGSRFRLGDDEVRLAWLWGNWGDDLKRGLLF